MKQSLVICDENPMHLSYLKQTLEDYDSKGNFEISAFAEGILLDRALDTLHMDVVFLDMSMSGANSIYLGRRIREKYPHARIILVTESNSFELSAYELRASYYLVKPIMVHKIHSILDELCMTEPDITSIRLKWFSIETKKRNVRVAYEDICYIEKDQRKVVVHTSINSWDFYGTFKEVRELLDMEHMFVQCHQGFIVNINRVSVMESDGIKLTDGKWIPVSRRFRHIVEDAYLKNGKSVL